MWTTLWGGCPHPPQAALNWEGRSRQPRADLTARGHGLSVQRIVDPLLAKEPDSIPGYRRRSRAGPSAAGDLYRRKRFAVTSRWATATSSATRWPRAAGSVRGVCWRARWPQRRLGALPLRRLAAGAGRPLRRPIREAGIAFWVAVDGMGAISPPGPILAGCLDAVRGCCPCALPFRGRKRACAPGAVAALDLGEESGGRWRRGLLELDSAVPLGTACTRRPGWVRRKRDCQHQPGPWDQVSQGTAMPVYSAGNFRSRDGRPPVPAGRLKGIRSPGDRRPCFPQRPRRARCVLGLVDGAGCRRQTWIASRAILHQFGLLGSIYKPRCLSANPGSACSTSAKSRDRAMTSRSRHIRCWRPRVGLRFAGNCGGPRRALRPVRVVVL